jgi:hypothetical protein
MEQLIPLYVEGDLEADAANAVRAHVNGCEPCRALVAQYEASQDWLHTYTPPDFNEALLDSVRLGVMRALQEQGTRPTFFERFALLLTPRRIVAATAAAMIIIAAFVLYSVSNKSNIGLNRAERAFVQPREEKPAPPFVMPPHDVIAPDGGVKPVKHARRKKPASVYLATGNAHRSPRRIERVPQNDNALAHDNRPPVPDESVKPPEMLRIELQTADPNIRIIWLAPKETDSQELKPMIETR